MSIQAADAFMSIFGFKRVEDNETAEERAAIMEFDGGIPRAKAEALAKAEVESYRAHREKVDSDKVAK
jgi:hypothetical protein